MVDDTRSYFCLNGQDKISIDGVPFHMENDNTYYSRIGITVNQTNGNCSQFTNTMKGQPSNQIEIWGAYIGT